MKIFCPKCNASYDVDDEFQGKMANCEYCGEKFLIRETVSLKNGKIMKKKLPFYRKAIVFFGAIFLAMAVFILISGMKISNGKLFFNQDYLFSLMVFGIGGVFCAFAPFCKKS